MLERGPGLTNSKVQQRSYVMSSRHGIGKLAAVCRFQLRESKLVDERQAVNICQHTLCHRVIPGCLDGTRSWVTHL